MSSQTQTSDRPTNAHGGTERIDTIVIGAGQAGLATGTTSPGGAGLRDPRVARPGR